MRDDQISVVRVVRVCGSGEKREQQRSIENVTQHALFGLGASVIWRKRNYTAERRTDNPVLAEALFNQP